MVRAALLAAALLWAGPASACRLALVLGMDVSVSVDAAEDRLQREGLAAALRAPDVAEAIFASPAPVAIYAFEWSGATHQRILANWTLISDPAALSALADRIARSQRSGTGRTTAIGYALAHAHLALQDAPDCQFQTIDIAGDGTNNAGPGPRGIKSALPLDWVTINGLVIAGEDASVIDYYQQEVIQGPGAFVEVADGYADYAAAMRRKLVRELSAQILGALPPPPGDNG